MFKIFKKIILLGFIIFSLNLIFFGIATILFPSKSILPEFNDFINEHNYKSVDYLFIGSSRTYTAMNLESINSHLFLPKEQLRVLGIPSVSFPQLYFITKRILENTNPKQHVFVELSSRNETFEYHPKFILEEPYILLKNNFSLLYLFKSFTKRFENGFNWLSKFRINSNNWKTSGFYTMEEIAERLPSTNDQNIEMLRSSISELDLFNPLKLTDHKTYLDETKELNFYVSLLLEMAKERGVDLVFYAPSRLSQKEYNIILPVLQKIPNRNQINPNINPKFRNLMSKQYLWDKGHFNKKGSMIYGDIVGKIIAKRDSLCFYKDKGKLHN